MTTPELDAEAVREWGRRSRVASGVPEKITDPAILGRLVTLAGIDGEPQPEQKRPRSGSHTARTCSAAVSSRHDRS